MLAALEKSLGVVTTASRACGVSRMMHYYWMNNDPKYKAAVDELADLALDFAESKLHSQIADSNTAATIFYLKTKGKSRGYIERYDVTSNEQTIGTQTIVIGGKEIRF